MSLKDSIRKLMEGDNEEDWKLAIELLESNEMSKEDKLSYLGEYIEENKKEFTEKEFKILKMWLDAMTNNNNQFSSYLKIKLWILKNH